MYVLTYTTNTSWLFYSCNFVNAKGVEQHCLVSENCTRSKDFCGPVKNRKSKRAEKDADDMDADDDEDVVYDRKKLNNGPLCKKK